MRISKVVEIYPVRGREVYVKAIAEASRLIYHQTQYDPPEYGDSYVETFISILDLEEFFDIDITEDSIIEDYVNEYLEEIDYELDWRLIENDY